MNKNVFSKLCYLNTLVDFQVCKHLKIPLNLCVCVCVCVRLSPVLINLSRRQFSHLYYSIQSCMILYSVLQSCIVLYCPVQSCVVLYNFVQSYIVLYSSVQSHIVLCSPVHDLVIFLYIVLYGPVVSEKNANVFSLLKPHNN